MTKETIRDLNRNTLIGFTEKRGKAWHYREGEQGGEPNHYPGAIPVPDVRRRLFNWEAESVPAGRLLPARFNRNAGRPLWTVTENRRSIIRSDTGAELGSAGPGYVIHQYDKWLLETVGSILDSDLEVGSAGLLKGGAVAFVSVEVPENVTTPEGVTFRPHLLAVTSHDGSLETTFKRTVTVVVCDNTMSVALAGAGEVSRVRHSRKSQLRLAEVRRDLSVVYGIADEFSAEVRRLTETKVTDVQWNEFLDATGLAPPAAETLAQITRKDGSVDVISKSNGRAVKIIEEHRDKLNDLWRNDPRVSPWTNTAYGVLAATNTYQHHEARVKGMPRDERNTLNALSGKTMALDNYTLRKLDAVLALH